MAREGDGVSGNDHHLDLGTFVGPSGAFAASAWIYPEASGSRGIIVGYTGGTSNAYVQFMQTGTRRIRCRIHQVRDTDYIGRTTADNDVTLNVWQHILVVWDGGTTNAAIRIYIDNTQKDANDDGAGTFTAANANGVRWFIGAQKNSAAPASEFDGRFAELATWGVALSAGERSALAGGVSPLRIRPGSLELYLPSYGAADPEPDYSGNGRNGTVNGPIQADHAPVAPPFGFGLGWQGAFTAAAGGGGSARRRVGIGAGQAMRR